MCLESENPGWVVPFAFVVFRANHNLMIVNVTLMPFFNSVPGARAKGLLWQPDSGALALALNTDRNADICGLNCNLCSCNIEALRSNCKCNAFPRIVCANLTGSGPVFGYTINI